MKRKRYTEEFKEQAIGMALESGKPIQEVADSLGVGVWSIRQWKNDYLRTNSESLRSKGKITTEEEVKILKKEMSDLKMENTILKKFAAILSKDQL